ncbi:MAG: hypothetical protein ACI4O3_04350 [Oscillospiraceae bacterium]
MDFAEKLKFLMHITQTSNKELAAALSVDRSFISLMRTGRRGLPKSPELVRQMTVFFAKRTTADFQLHALSEMLGQVAVRSAMPAEALAAYLEKWLLGSTSIVEEIAEGIKAVPAKLPEAPAKCPAPVPENQATFFYGEEGRREAMRQIMQMLRDIETPASILMVLDDNLEWLLSDYRLSRQIQADLMELTERGFTFYQILPPMNYINRYTESLKFWLPMYATGKMKVYYYPRLRGNLYRHSIITVPDHYVQYSCAIAPGSTSDVTMFSTDPRLVSAFVMQFQEHMSLCRPALNVYRDPNDFFSVFPDMFKQQGELVQMVNPLGALTLPRELLERFIREAEYPAWTRAFQLYLDELPHFEKRLEQNLCLDISTLATAEEVRAGKVSVLPSLPGQLYYTPETYVTHLQNILRLMDRYENYCFLPAPAKEKTDYNLIVNEGGMALLIRSLSPALLLEIRRPEMVIACREHLLRKAEGLGFGKIQREKTRMELKALIRELQD